MTLIDLIQNNPFRVLGVFVNTSTREVVSNINHLKAYLKVGKEIHFEADFETFLSKLARTPELLDKASSDINQMKGKVMYSLFWFAKVSPLDEIALGYLNAGDVDKTKKILEKHATYSSLLNRGVIALYEKDLACALSVYNHLIHESQFRNEFISAVLREKTNLSEQELAHIFFDALLDVFPAIDILSSFDSTSNVEDLSYVKGKAISIPLEFINSSILQAKNADNAAASQLEAGWELMEKTKSYLAQLKHLIGLETQYEIVSDNLAKQIRQCVINCCNKSSDIDKVRKAMVLLQYALSIAVGELTEESLQETIDALKEKIDTLPPNKLLPENLSIRNLLAQFEQGGKTIDDILKLIEECGPHLATIKEEQGIDGRYYKHISTEVEETALNATISNVNAALNRLKGDFDMCLTLENIKSTLAKAWEVTLCLDQFDLEDKAKNRFNSQRTTLSQLLLQVGIYSNHIVSTFKIETETDVFKGCRTKNDYKNYLLRFPNGKYVAVANQKIAELEKQELEENQKFRAFIGGVSSFSAAIALYPKCKDRKTVEQLDEKCYSLCRSNSDYKRYIQVFGEKAIHNEDAESHLKFERSAEKIMHNVWIITCILIVAVLVSVGLIWGPIGYSKILWVIGIISGIVAWASKDEGCLFSLVAGLIAVASILGASFLEDYAEKHDYRRFAFQEAVREQKQAAEGFESLKISPTVDNCISLLDKHTKSDLRDSVITIYYYSASRASVIDLNEFASKFSNTALGGKADKRVKQICDSLYHVAENKNRDFNRGLRS